MENLKSTQYDDLQRVKQIDIDGYRRFAFEYQPRGIPAREKLYVPGQTQPLEELSYRLTLQDWTQRIATPGASPRFKVELQYGSLYNGMLQNAEYAYQLDASTRRTQSYNFAYDGLERLTQAGTASDPGFASYDYDAQGRLTRKKEGSSILPAYVYASGKNQLDRIPGHSNKGVTNAYVYDPDGNLVLDRSKRMVIDYDALGQAIAFRTYQTLPSANLTWADVEGNGLAAPRFGCILQRTVTMAYDPFGQRVFKYDQGQPGENAIAYVGSLAELVSPDGDGPWTLETVNHWTPAGLRGRRVGNAEYTYLTDHMGSVRMGLSANGTVVEGMDYAPYGTPIRLTVSQSGMARAGYTEKELDAETGLTYFGARYLDAEVGMWTTTDPMAQYHSAYNFVGGDPVNYVDLWGLEAAPDGFDPGLESGFTGHEVSGANNGNIFVSVHSAPSLPEPAPISVTICCNEFSNASRGRPVPIEYSTDKHPGNTEEIGPITSEEYKQLHKAGMESLMGGVGPEAVAGKGARLMASAAKKLSEKIASALEQGAEKGVEEGVEAAARGNSALNRAGQVLDRGGLTKAGRALEKHGSRSGSVFPKATGDVAAKNAQGQGVLNDILGNISKTSANKFGGSDYYGGKLGGGGRFDASGNFMGFLEP
jgi:RHS repeat-associated protein